MELIIYSVQVIHLLVSILLIIVVLLQPGKSGDLGSVFGGGGGSSESVFGAAGAVPFLAKVTRVLAVLFLLSSLTLGYFASQNVSSSVVTDVPSSQQSSDIAPSGDFTQTESTEGETTQPEVTQSESEQAPSQDEAQSTSEQEAVEAPETGEASPGDTEETQ